MSHFGLSLRLKLVTSVPNGRYEFLEQVDDQEGDVKGTMALCETQEPNVFDFDPY